MIQWEKDSEIAFLPFKFSNLNKQIENWVYNFIDLYDHLAELAT